MEATLSYICEYCKNSFSPAETKFGKRFCSHSCNTSNNNKNRIWKQSSKDKIIANAKQYKGVNNPNYRGGGLNFICMECSGSFNVERNQVESGKHSGKFCSASCWKLNASKKRQPRDKTKIVKQFGRVLCRLIKRPDIVSSTSDWFRLVGWNMPEFRAHMEPLFEEGMSWSNHGDWHIDHVKPVSYFEFDDFNDKGFKKCWDLSNLQPLWALENLSKGGTNTYLNQVKFGIKR